MMHLYWVALKSIWAKEIHRFMRIWVQTLVPPVITMTLYFIIFGNLIGSRIGDMHGFSYMQFIVPGLIMMSVITNAYANVASSFFGAKFQRNIEELLVAPVPTHVIIAGYVGGGVARGLFVGILVTAISLFFVPFQVHSWVFVALTLVLTAVLFFTHSNETTRSSLRDGLAVDYLHSAVSRNYCLSCRWRAPFRQTPR